MRLKSTWVQEQFSLIRVVEDMQNFGRLDTASAQAKLASKAAWQWLVHQGYLIHQQGQGDGAYYVLAPKAQRMDITAPISAVNYGTLLSKSVLNPRIAEQVWDSFSRGKFDTAVFEAMKAVEVAVREAACFDNNALGVTMMRNAFASAKGPLTDGSMEGGERTARMELFAGAIGSYKNAHSHRDVKLEDPQEAFEIIMLANHLLRIVDGRFASKAAV